MTREDTARIREMQDDSGIAIMAMAKLSADTDAVIMDALLAHPPFMLDTKLDDIDRLALHAARLTKAGTVVWVNSLDVSHCLDFNDTNALKDADRIWGKLIAAGVNAIQTDESGALIAWLANRRAAG